jgi:hypothetical protein
MAVVMVQKPLPGIINVVNYIEEKYVNYADLVATMDRLRYRWGVDWMPFDAVQHHPTSGTNAIKQMRGLRGSNLAVKMIPRSDPEARIRAARMMSPRVYMDTGKHDTPADRPDQLLGAGHLMDRLKMYRRTVPKITNEPTTPFHGPESHGADAFGGLAEIVDQIRNAGDDQIPKLPGFRNQDASMGMLG